jgi:hypothetical protein
VALSLSGAIFVFALLCAVIFVAVNRFVRLAVLDCALIAGAVEAVLADSFASERAVDMRDLSLP